MGSYSFSKLVLLSAISWLVIFLAIFFVVGCNSTGKDAVMTGEKLADTVLVKGNFYTVDEKNSRAEAVAIEDGTIVYVGSMKGIDPYIGKKTEVIDLKGKFAMPSFVDSHMHPLSNAYAINFQAALFNLSTHEEYIKAIREFAEKHPNMDGIMGGGFEPIVYAATGGAKKEALDAIDSTRPIGIVSKDIHAMWVNSKALAMAGITKDTPNPEGGVIERDPTTGEPTGMLMEMPAMSLVWNLLPAATKEDYKTSLLWMQDYLNRKGITTAHDAWAEYDPNYYKAFGELAKEGKLTVRYRGSWLIDPNAEDTVTDQIDHGFELSERFNHPHFKVHSFKFMADGIVEDATALLIDPYANDSSSRGIKKWKDRAMVNAFAKVDRAGYQIHTHAIGDGAVKYTVAALEQVQTLNGKRDSRHSLAHVQLARPEDVTKMGELGLSAHMSQYWMIMDDGYDTFYLPNLGDERANNTYPHQSLIDAGVNVPIASDFITSEPDLMTAIYNGMTRSSAGGEQLLPASECVTLKQMLKAATINGAYANFLENEIGSLEVGKKADIVVLSKNLFEIKTKNIPDVEIKMTFFEGKRVH